MLSRQVWLGALLAVLSLALFVGLVPEVRAQTVVVGTVPDDWPLKPSGLGPGDRFRLLFVTSTQRNAASRRIADYDAFVQGRAAVGHTAIRAHSSHFRVLGSTLSTNAREHTHSLGTGSEAIYWLNGAKAADNYADFYDGTWDSGVARSEFGGTMTLGANAVFTGTASNGLKHAFELGGPNLHDNVKTSSPGNSSPLDGGGLRNMNQQGRFYALSLTFQVEQTITITQKGQTATRDASGRRRVDEGTTLTYTVQANKASPSALDVTLTVAETGAFVASSAKSVVTVTIPANATSVDHDIVSSNDTTDEVNGTLTVTLRDDPGYALGADTSVVDIIRDNDATTVTLSAPAGNITEGQTKTITVGLSRSLASGEVLPVPLTFTGGATRGTDYTLTGTAATGVAYANLNSGNATVTFTGGTSASATATLTLTATGDNTVESSGETVSVGFGTLTSASGTGLGGPLGGGAQGSGSVSFTIADPPLSVVSITAGTSPVTEGTAADFTVRALPWPTAPLSVSLTVSEDTSAGRDFVATSHEGSQSVTIPTSGSVSYSVPTEADSTDEPNGAVTVTVASATTYTVASMSAATVVVHDTPHTVSVSIEADAVEGDAGTTEKIVTFTTTPPRTQSFDIGVCLSGSATHGENADYRIVDWAGQKWGFRNGCFIGGWPVPGIRDNFQIQVRGDTALEPDETVVLTLQQREETPSDVVISSTAGAATYIIQNDDAPPINLSVNNNGAVTEGGTLTVTATAGQAPSGRSLSIPLQRVATHSTAVAADYTVAGSITIADGQTSGTATLTAVNDVADEPTETLRLALGALPSGYDPGLSLHVDLTLADNDATTVTLTTPDTTATEGSSSDTAQIMLTLNRALHAGESLAIPLGFTGGTLNTDFTLALTGSPQGVALSSATVTFTGGSTPSAAAATVQLTAATDSDIDDETVTVSIPPSSSGTAPILIATGLGGGATGSRTGNGQIMLADADKPSITASFASSASSAAENAGTHNVTVELSAAPQAGITLSYTVGGTATSGSDYTSLSGSVAAVAGAMSVNIPVMITDDSVLREPDETVVLTLTAGSGYTVGSMSVHTLTITDNDGITMTPTELDEGENVRFTLTNAPLGPGMTINFQSNRGTATFNTDYTVGGHQRLGPVYFYLHGLSDNLFEGDETIRLVLGLGSGVTYNANITLRDRTTTPVELSVSDNGVVAEGGTLTITATLGVTNPTTSALSIPIQVRTSGTTADASDYTVAASISIASNSRSGSTTFMAIGDQTAEGGETVVIELGANLPSVVRRGMTNHVAITVNDPVVITPQRLNLDEGGTAGSYTVVLGGAPTEDVTVTATSAEPTSAQVAADDELPGASVTLTFSPSDWDQAQTVTVTPHAADADSTDETFPISHTVSGPGVYANVIAPSVTVVVDDDDPPGGGSSGGGSSGGGSRRVRDTHGNSPASATDIPLSPDARAPRQSGTLTDPTDVDYFRLELFMPGLLWVETQGSTDTSGRLFDAAQTLLASDEDSGSSGNFALATAAAAGVYYLAVDSSRGATGAYSLVLDYRPGQVENPLARAQSGIGVISGWVCEAETVEIVLTSAGVPSSRLPAAYGTARADTAAVCGHSTTGFGLLFNWNLLGDGERTVRVLVDGVELAARPVIVTTLREEYREGLRGSFVLEDFPQAGETTLVVWSEAQQNFVIGAGAIVAGRADQWGVAGVAQLENPAPGTYQSGIGVISGWVCEAETVEIVLTSAGRPPSRLPAAYGTARADTAAVCGHSTTGFGLLFNWNLLDDGEHVVALIVDGETVAQSTVQVTTLGGEYLSGLRGTYELEGFPTAEETVMVEWQEQQQNFAITAVQ